MPPAKAFYCKYDRCGEPDEAAHSEGCKSHPRIHADVVKEALLKKTLPAGCCPKHRLRAKENAYRARRRKREALTAKAPIGRRVAAAVAAGIDADLAAWKRST